MTWKKLSSTLVYENDWMRVHEDEVVNPGGGRNRYGHVHFKNIAVAILPLDEDGNTWLVGQSRYTLGEYSWELPMGGAPTNETPLEAARRELKEETGLTAASWTEVLRLHPSNSITDEVGVVFLPGTSRKVRLILKKPRISPSENCPLRRQSGWRWRGRSPTQSVSQRCWRWLRRKTADDGS